MGTKGHELIPSARRMMTSLRDMGYDFAAAVADVADNSIEAKAKSISIDVQFDGDESTVRIADNGRGMKPADIREALRYGAEREYEETDLGKFGLGLKTASLSQCQRLTVASRSSKDRAEIAAYCWDVQHIQETDKWEVLEVPRETKPELLRAPLIDHPGTVVLWERLDRILGYKHPYGEFAKKRLSAMCRELEQHLGMVLHRFIKGEAGQTRRRFRVNGNEVRAWDPFARDEPDTKVLDPVTLRYDRDGIQGDILIEPYVLPPQSQFSSPEAHSAASGPARWNRQQGFYIYRAGRMIQSGGWSNLRTLDEHTKLARIAVSFAPVLDEAFQINVSKMRVQLPQQLRDDFEALIAPVIKTAQAAYRKPKPPSRALMNAQTDGSHQPSGAGASAVGRPGALPSGSTDSRVRETQSDYASNEQRWTLDELRRAAERVAMPQEQAVVRAVFARLALELKHE